MTNYTALNGCWL